MSRIDRLKTAEISWDLYINDKISAPVIVDILGALGIDIPTSTEDHEWEFIDKQDNLIFTTKIR